MLKQKGLIAEQSLVDEIENKPNMPRLPGLPSYLPHQSTIETAKRVMFDILRLWQKRTNKDPQKQEDITRFITFTVKEMQRQLEKVEAEIKKTPKLIMELERKNKEVPTLHEVFTSVRKRDVVKGLSHFFVDSFAVCVIVKKNESVSDYVGWFFPWCDSLYDLWVKKEVQHDKHT
jgi:hypothetical protein